jgi:hypothetical protein
MKIIQNIFAFKHSSLRARYERGNLVAIQGEDAQLRDCFVPRNDNVFLTFNIIKVYNACI